MKRDSTRQWPAAAGTSQRNSAAAMEACLDVPGSDCTRTTMTTKKNINRKSRIPDALEERLRQHPVLSQFRQINWKHLVAHSGLREILPAAAICREGQPAQHGWLIVKGEVKLVRHTTKGQVLLVDILLPGNFSESCFTATNPFNPPRPSRLRRLDCWHFRFQFCWMNSTAIRHCKRLCSKTHASSCASPWPCAGWRWKNCRCAWPRFSAGSTRSLAGSFRKLAPLSRNSPAQRRNQPFGQLVSLRSKEYSVSDAESLKCFHYINYMPGRHS